MKKVFRIIFLFHLHKAWLVSALNSFRWKLPIGTHKNFCMYWLIGSKFYLLRFSAPFIPQFDTQDKTLYQRIQLVIT